MRGSVHIENTEDTEIGEAYPLQRKEHPILFSGAMVRAILKGRKHQTRRVITRRNSLVDGRSSSQDFWDKLNFDDAYIDNGPSPAGNPGPYLHVSHPMNDTVHRIYPRMQTGDRLWARETFTLTQYGKPVYRATATDRKGMRWSSIEVDNPEHEVLWKPSIFMPRWASRILLEEKGVRVERIQDITNEDARAEGTASIKTFIALWNSINAKRGYGWEANPWVWVNEFSVLYKGKE